MAVVLMSGTIHFAAMVVDDGVWSVTTKIRITEIKSNIITKKGCEPMALPQENIYTIDDIYALPDGQRAELIDGQIYYMAPPERIHQKLAFSLSRTIADYIDNKGGTCEVYLAPFAVFLNKDNNNYVEPDISVICDKNKLDDKGCNGAPDWVIEAVSPSSKRMDYFIKLFKYRSAGVREYWIIDPDKNKVTVWDFMGNNTEEYTFSDTVTVNIYDDFAIDFSKLKFK